MKTTYVKRSFRDGHTDAVSSISLSPLSDNKFASGGDDSLLLLWSPNHPQPQLQMTLDSPISVVRMSEMEENRLFAAHDKYVSVIDLRNSASVLERYELGEDEINDIDVFSEGENILGACDDSGSVNILDRTTGLVVKSMRKHENICSSVRFRRHRPSEVVTGGLDCCLYVTDWKGSGRAIHIFRMNELVETDENGDEILPEAESDGSESEADEDSEPEEEDEDEEDPILSANEDSGDDQSDLIDESLLRSQRFIHASINQAQLPINPPMVYDMAASTGDNLLALAMASGNIQIFDSTKKRLAHQMTLYGHSSSVSKVHFTQDDTLISGGNDKRLLIYTNLNELLHSNSAQDNVICLDKPCNQFTHGSKINSIAGRNLENIYVADTSNEILLCDLR